MFDAEYAAYVEAGVWPDGAPDDGEYYDAELAVAALRRRRQGDLAGLIGRSNERRHQVRAQVQRGFGGAEVVAFEDRADPGRRPAARSWSRFGPVRLNRLDLLQREAPLVRGFALPHIAGMDVAGVVVDRGDVLDAAVLPRSAPRCSSIRSARAACAIGAPPGSTPYCENLRTVGSTRPGGFAELVAAPADRCHPIPAGMSFVEAATAAGRRT